MRRSPIAPQPLVQNKLEHSMMTNPVMMVEMALLRKIRQENRMKGAGNRNRDGLRF